MTQQMLKLYTELATEGYSQPGAAATKPDIEPGVYVLREHG